MTDYSDSDDSNTKIESCLDRSRNPRYLAIDPIDKTTILKMYELSLQKWFRRQNNEWQVTISMWSGTFIIFATLTGRVTLTFQDPGWIIVVLLSLILFCAYYFFWLKNLWGANDRDKEMALFYKSLVDNCYGIEKEKEYPLDWKHSWGKFFKDYSMQFQGFFELLLIVMGIIILFVFPAGSTFIR